MMQTCWNAYWISFTLFLSKIIICLQIISEPIPGLMSVPPSHVQALLFCRGCWSDSLTCLRCMKPWALCWWGWRRITLQRERWVIYHFVNHFRRHSWLSNGGILYHLQVYLDDNLQSLIDTQAESPAQQLCSEAATILLGLIRVIISQVKIISMLSILLFKLHIDV